MLLVSTGVLLTSALAILPRAQAVYKPDVYILMVAGIGSHSNYSQDDDYFGTLPSAIENALMGYGYTCPEAHQRVLYLSYKGKYADSDRDFTRPNYDRTDVCNQGGNAQAFIGPASQAGTPLSAHPNSKFIIVAHSLGGE
jgi:hypothetical protein